eukprot:TRINITY_DN4103_c0_g1_i1.p1 TRINITY_DN4103_c0_g1~~TRINITY_DN4103_c0_g1_i1.p1  ORF type:complete len:240 (+),score=30.15 TRINITY_DN4103_c0_g1_i1:92-811(+)
MQSHTQYSHHFEKESLEESGRSAHSSLNLEFTKFCNFYRCGKCLKGSSCTYAHSMKSLQARPDLQKTILCKFFSEGNCSSGLSCRYAHGDKELCRQGRSSMTPGDMNYAKACPSDEDDHEQLVCKRFLKGKCRSKGCKFTHPQPQNDESNESGNESSEAQCLLDRLQALLQIPKSCRFLHLKPQNDESNESGNESNEVQYLLDRLQASLQIPNSGGQRGVFYFPGIGVIQEIGLSIVKL